MYNGDVVEISVPWLNINVFSALKSEPILSMRKFRIKKTLYRMMMHRLQSSKSGLDEILAYARTLASTYETTQ